MLDLIVDDQYVKDLGSYYKKYAKQMQSAIDEYLSTMNWVAENAIKSGTTYDALNSFLVYAKKLQDIVSSFGIEIESVCNRFIEEIDEKDQYLY